MTGPYPTGIAVGERQRVSCQLKKNYMIALDAWASSSKRTLGVYSRVVVWGPGPRLQRGKVSAGGP